MVNNWRKTFFTIWVGQTISHFSSSVIHFAIIWYLTDTTNSALILSAAMLMGFLPQGLLGPFIGVYIDRYNRKTIMILSDIFIAGVSLILVAVSFFGKPQVWVVLLVLLLRSLGTAFHNPCLQAVTPEIVPAEYLSKCSGYSQSMQSISQIISPAVAAVLYSSWSLGSIIFLDVIGAAFAVITLIKSKIPTASHHVDMDGNMIREAKEGLKILKSNKGMMGLVLISALYTFCLMPTSALFPLMSMSHFGGTSYHASVAEVAFSIGLLIGSIVLGIWGGTKNKVYTIVGSYLLMSISLIISGLLPPDGFKIFIVLSCLMGVSGPFYWGMYTPLLQQSFEQKYMGRVMSLSSSIMLITAPFSLSFSGLLAELLGVEMWFLLAGIILLIATVLCLAIPDIRHSGLIKKPQQ